MKIAVWLARLLLGGTFIVSGVTKMVDPYGTLTKIEAYLSAWGLTDIIAPGLALIGGCALALIEFVIGVLLFSGSLRRSAAWLSLAVMAVMLPLTVYIAIANPVADCGCFGDFLVISNTATMLKNVVLTALAVFLCRYNRRARCLFSPWIQWVEIAAAVAYMLCLAMIGYHEQPLLDFRPYPVGEPLVDDGENDQMAYVYVKDGLQQEFAEDELPDEADGWEFVDVKHLSPASGKMFALFDRRTGAEVTADVVGETRGQLLLLIPHPSEAGASGSYTANELQAAMESRYGRGAFVAVMAADSAAVERAMDLMMADYPVYYADSKVIMAVARGQMAAVYLSDGVVRWKRTLSSINLDLLTPDSDPAEVYATNGPRTFRILTALYIAANIAILIVGLLPYATRLRHRRQRVDS